MGNPRCGVCGGATKRNGTTSAGTQRWRCKACGASSVRKIGTAAKSLALFLRWLLSKDSIADLGVSRATFWRKTAWAWRIWPVAPAAGEVHDVVFLDGIWLRREAVVLVAVAGGRVAAWHLARSECSAAWAALMRRMPAPAMLVSDGSTGLAKAAAEVWPGTRAQRCTFHVAAQVKRLTTLRPRTEAGRELLAIADALLKVGDADAAAAWVAAWAGWCSRWDAFLREHAFREGRRVWTHERLRKARRSLNRRLREGTLFTYVEMARCHGGRWPATNNAVESVNARLREVLRRHRGLPLMHRIKAVFWWCYMHTEEPLSPAGILRAMPTDDEVEGLFRAASGKGDKGDGSPSEYGTGIEWGEFHMPAEFRR